MPTQPLLPGVKKVAGGAGAVNSHDGPASAQASIVVRRKGH